MDISVTGSTISQVAGSSAVIRPPERTESERVEAKDSEVERGEAERSENRLQNKANERQYVQERQDNRSATNEAVGNQVDVLV